MTTKAFLAQCYVGSNSLTKELKIFVKCDPEHYIRVSCIYV